jgi:general secretion pathway protein D
MTMTKRLPSPPARWRCACVAVSLLASPMLHAQTGAESAAQSPAMRSRQQVTLNFVNAEIEAVTRAMGAMLDRQFVVDPRVKGQITVYSEQPMTVREAYLNYLAALRGLGFTVVENAGLLKVVPEADAKLQAGTVAVGPVPARGDQVITQIFRLNHENPNNLVAVLRPLISPNNTINASLANNSLVITDYADNLQRLGKIIAALDQPAATDIEVIQLQHAVASDIAPIVLRLADGGAAVPGAPVAAAGGASVLADARSNSLIIRAASPAKLAQMRAVIQKLDLPQQRGSGPAGNIWVVYLKNADATKLATVLRAAFGGAGGGGGGAPATPAAGISGVPTSGSTLGGNVTSLGGTAAGGTAATPATAPVAASAGPSTGGFIQADPSTNSLIITASEPLYRQLRSVIDQLDARRAQVYVESMIVKMDANKAAEFGFQWQNLWGKKGDSTIPGAGTNFSAGTDNILNLSAAAATGRTGAGRLLESGGIAGGLNIGILKKIGEFYTLGALAHFLETDGGANVLSTPNLVALDNEEAKIVIGQNVPFVTGSFTNTGAGAGSVNPFQTIERKDVGLTLRIKSQIGESGTIRMTIFQENSSVTDVSATTGPTTDKSSIETTVVVDDGQVMVLGGLLKDEYADNEDRVPGLGSIPILGNLFRSESRRRIKSNLLVFLRPVVLRTQPQADALTIDRYEAIRAQQMTSQPKPSVLLPVNDAPILPPLPPPAAAPLPVTPPPAATPAPLGESTTAPASRRERN